MTNKARSIDEVLVEFKLKGLMFESREVKNPHWVKGWENVEPYHQEYRQVKTAPPSYKGAYRLTVTEFESRSGEKEYRFRVGRNCWAIYCPQHRCFIGHRRDFEGFEKILKAFGLGAIPMKSPRELAGGLQLYESLELPTS
jgi:hypothetical protein